MKRLRHLFGTTIPRSVLIWAALILVAFTGSPAIAAVAGPIALYPQNPSVEMASATYQFTSYVPISPNTIEWLVNGIVGGNATVGTIKPGWRLQAAGDHSYAQCGHGRGTKRRLSYLHWHFHGYAD